MAMGSLEVADALVPVLRTGSLSAGRLVFVRLSLPWCVCDGVAVRPAPGFPQRDSPGALCDEPEESALWVAQLWRSCCRGRRLLHLRAARPEARRGALS